MAYLLGTVDVSPQPGRPIVRVRVSCPDEKDVFYRADAQALWDLWQRYMQRAQVSNYVRDLHGMIGPAPAPVSPVPTDDASEIPTAFRRRTDGALRLPPLLSGYRDPLNAPTDAPTDAPNERAL